MITAEGDAETALCAGGYRRITPSLLVYDENDNPIDEDQAANILGEYIFDWYLGSMDDYDAITQTFITEHPNLLDENDEHGAIKEAIQTYRGRNQASYDNSPFEKADIEAWLKNNPDNPEYEAYGNLLISLFDKELLRTGTPAGNTFTLQVESKFIVAIPSVETKAGYLFCTNATEVPLPITDNESPVILAGIKGVSYPYETSAPLRLGFKNVDLTLELPVRSIDKLATDVGATHLGLSIPAEQDGVEILLDDEAQNYPTVGLATSLFINEDAVTAGTAKLSFHLTEAAKTFMREGLEYKLLIPFVQYQNTAVLTSECDGWLSLSVKIVPEYLTWSGDNTGKWFNDKHWKQSTEGDLYFDNAGTSTTDANGSDDVNNAFSPLYFTKITIPVGKELALDYKDQPTPTTVIDLNSETDKSDNIQYDLAVTGVENNIGKIGAYYINKVEQIYFKPEASIYRQDYLTYEKAWVDFEMEEGKPYWMSAPLQNVYAGDMYAPSDDGRQKTAVFGDGITFAGKNEVEAGTAIIATNSRWSPAFYQKAWDKAISYITKEGYTHNAHNATDVAAVKSNWSIEYNDVWVPYSLGKGFYSRVEEVNNTVGEDGTAVAQVRLPKADTKYSYETKALNNPKGEEIERTNNGQMADEQEITITLSDSDDNNEMVDGDGEHFLIGNPYMGYLNMTAFFDANKNKDVLEEDKFWTLDRDNGSIVVGTPDVTDWGNGKTTGYVAPMTAFFVELKEGLAAGASKTITFNTSMIAQKPTTTENVYTKSFAATNPTLTITAERGETRSVAKLLTSDKAENGYRASEDAVVLLDSELDAPMVYTVAGSRAAQVNAVKKISNIGLGVYNAGDDEATLTISGISRMATPLYLYDAATRQSTRLEGDSYELRVSGDSHGRYFLRDAELGDELENTISIYSARPGEVIVSSLRPVKDIRVFALNGSQVRRFSVNTTRYTFTLPAGIYLIQATDGERGQTEKVLVR